MPTVKKQSKNNSTATLPFNSPDKKKLSGFTLIELMVVSSIMTVVMLAVYSSFSSGLKLWQRSKDVSDIEYKILLGLEKFSSQLRQSVNFPQVGGQCAGFSGGKDRFSFYSLKGQEIIRITFEFNPTKKSLMRKVDKYQDIVEGKEVSDGAPFMRGIDAVDFFYFYNEKTQQKFLWKDDQEWATEDGIPTAVKIIVKYKNGMKSETVFIPIG